MCLTGDISQPIYARRYSMEYTGEMKEKWQQTHKKEAQIQKTDQR